MIDELTLGDPGAEGDGGDSVGEAGGAEGLRVEDARLEGEGRGGDERTPAVEPDGARLFRC